MATRTMDQRDENIVKKGFYEIIYDFAGNNVDTVSSVCVPA